MYRDASNYKSYGQVVVRGELTYEQLAPHFLDMAETDTGFFNPTAVELPHPGREMRNFPGTDDHDWCELYKDDIKLMDSKPTEKQSAEELIELFRVSKENEEHGKNPSPGLIGESE
jgi:hypothetical protein